MQGPLVVYNAHLEVFCGLLARLAQLSDIFADARRQADAGLHAHAILGEWGAAAAAWVGRRCGGGGGGARLLGGRCIALLPPHPVPATCTNPPKQET